MQTYSYINCVYKIHTIVYMVLKSQQMYYSKLIASCYYFTIVHALRLSESVTSTWQRWM